MHIANMAWNLILVFVFCFIYFAESILLPLGWMTPKIVEKESLKKCVPSDTTRGPCTICVCNTDGVFICRPVKCIKDLHPTTEKHECQSNMRYIKDHTVCTCSKNSQWLSDTCRKVFRNFQKNTPLIHGNLRSNVTCKPNSLYLIDCNICKCDKSGYIQATACTNRRCKSNNKADICNFGDFLRTNNEMCLCSDVNYYIDKLCRKIDSKIVQEVKPSDVKVITNIGFKASKKCAAFREYYVDCNHCICDEDGKLICTKKDCRPKDNLRRQENIQQTELPTIHSENEPCTPGQRYKLKCNTCMCTPNKELSCTTMICLDEFIIDGLTLRRSLISTI